MVKYSEAAEEAEVIYENTLCSTLKRKRTTALFRALWNRNSDASNILAKRHCGFMTSFVISFTVNASIFKSAVAKLQSLVCSVTTSGTAELAGMVQIALSVGHFPAYHRGNFKESWQEEGDRKNLQQMRHHVTGRRGRCL